METLEITGRIFAVKRYAIHDGPGIRVTVFLKGCPLRCVWCHNPEGQGDDICVRADANDADGDGHSSVREVTVSDVLREIEKDVLFLDESGGGVTFSGGEPLAQPDFLYAALLECRRRDIHTVLDTCGYAPPEVFGSIIDPVDLFHYDLKLIDDQRHREFTGVSNEPILANLRTLEKRKKKVVIRFPLIPQITDTDDNIRQTTDFVSALDGVSDVALLPYHRTAEGKYKRLRIENRMDGVESLPQERIDHIRSQFEHRDLRVRVGG